VIVMSLDLYIPEREILEELLIRAKKEAYQQDCELGFGHTMVRLMYPSIGFLTVFKDRQYPAFLEGMRDRKENLTLLDVVDGFWSIMEDFADMTVPGDRFFDDIGVILAAGRRFPKVEMHFWTIYVLPHLCGWRELQDVFFDELRMIASQVQGEAYERNRKYHSRYLLPFPSAEEIVERTRQAAQVSEGDEKFSLSPAASRELDSMLVPYGDKIGTVEDWAEVIKEELRENYGRIHVSLFYWFAKYGLPYIFGLPQMMEKAFEVVSRLPIEREEGQE
jgi:hypothetical protein